jgi:hypothetical protein
VVSFMLRALNISQYLQIRMLEDAELGLNTVETKLEVTASKKIKMSV